MTDPIPFYAKPMPGGAPLLAEIIAAQPLASAILGFLLLYGLLAVVLRLADRIEPPPEPMRAVRQSEPPAPKIWRFRQFT